MSLTLYSRAAFVPTAAIDVTAGVMTNPPSESVSGVLSPATTIVWMVHDVSPDEIPAGTVRTIVDDVHDVIVDVALPDGHTKRTVPVAVPKLVPVNVTDPPIDVPVVVAGDDAVMSG